MNPDIGGLTVEINDRETTVSMTGGDTWTWPVGPHTLLDNEFERSDPPRPAHLTNALGLVHDHLDDVIVIAPTVLSTPSVYFVGSHAAVVGHVEVGGDQLPNAYELQRVDADEVFRTLVAESAVERRHNPGLDDADVESVVATLCIVLAIMRRLERNSVRISADLEGGQ